jgi:hypothetical protein
LPRKFWKVGLWDQNTTQEVRRRELLLWFGDFGEEISRDLPICSKAKIIIGFSLSKIKPTIRMSDDKISKRATIVAWEEDGKYLALKYRQDDGQVVIATMKRIGWERPPAEELKEIMAILNAGPQATVGKPRKAPPSR